MLDVICGEASGMDLNALCVTDEDQGVLIDADFFQFVHQ
jgi:hypothetical protein